jgi:hypothetical protein
MATYITSETNGNNHQIIITLTCTHNTSTYIIWIFQVLCHFKEISNTFNHIYVQQTTYYQRKFNFILYSYLIKWKLVKWQELGKSFKMF